MVLICSNAEANITTPTITTGATYSITMVATSSTLPRTVTAAVATSSTLPSTVTASETITTGMV